MDTKNSVSSEYMRKNTPIKRDAAKRTSSESPMKISKRKSGKTSTINHQEQVKICGSRPESLKESKEAAIRKIDVDGVTALSGSVHKSTSQRELKSTTSSDQRKSSTSKIIVSKPLIEPENHLEENYDAKRSMHAKERDAEMPVNKMRTSEAMERAMEGIMAMARKLSLTLQQSESSVNYKVNAESEADEGRTSNGSLRENARNDSQKLCSLASRKSQILDKILSITEESNTSQQSEQSAKQTHKNMAASDNEVQGKESLISQKPLGSLENVEDLSDQKSITGEETQMDSMSVRTSKGVQILETTQTNVNEKEIGEEPNEEDADGDLLNEKESRKVIDEDETTSSREEREENARVEVAEQPSVVGKKTGEPEATKGKHKTERQTKAAVEAAKRKLSSTTEKLEANGSRFEESTSSAASESRSSQKRSGWINTEDRTIQPFPRHTEMRLTANTYQLGPIRPFSPEEVKDILAKYLEDNADGIIAGVDGHKKAATGLRQLINNKKYDRYRILVVVTIGRLDTGNGFRMDFQSLWDPERDSYQFHVHRTDTHFIQALCFGIYRD